jgi:hypothetical protein
LHEYLITKLKSLFRRAPRTACRLNIGAAVPNNSFSHREVILLNELENWEPKNIVSPDHSTLRIGVCIELMLEKRTR